METLGHLRSWLASPVFPHEEEKTRQAFLINLIIQAGLAMVVSIFVLLPLISTETNATRFLIAVITIFVCLLVSKFLLNHGRVHETGLLITAVSWVTFASITLLGPEGLSGTPFIGAITLIPLIAGFVSGTRASVVVTGLNWVMGGILVWLESSGRIPIAATYEPLSRYLASMIMFSSFPLLVYLWRRNFDEAIEQVRVVEQAQQETAAYRVQNEALEEAVKMRTSALKASLTREQHLAEKLAIALEQETQLGNLRSRIITVVSHEFRTPLSIINSSAELLHTYYDKLSPEQLNAAHVRIQDAVFYLNDLLKDVTLVDQAQGERLRTSYRTIPFSTLCQELSEKLPMQVSQSQRVTFHFANQIETPVQTDLSLMEQLAGNLISNALKYSAATTPVQVHFWFDGPMLVLEVRDQGIGIPLPEQNRVFELFYRASNVDERRGLGLGLFIVQAICQMMQGSVQLVSQGEEQGTIFRVHLPLSPDLEQTIV